MSDLCRCTHPRSVHTDWWDDGNGRCGMGCTMCDTCDDPETLPTCEACGEEYTYSDEPGLVWQTTTSNGYRYTLGRSGPTLHECA